MDDDPTLREYLEARLDALDRLLRAELHGRDGEVATARSELDRRLDEMNELRRQIERERGMYVTTERYDEKHEDLARRINKVETFTANLTGRMIGLGLLGALFIAVIAAVVTHILGG